MTSFTSMFSAATSAAAKLAGALQGQQLPFELGPEVEEFAGKSPWQLYTGKKEGLGEVSIFMYDMKKGTDMQLALVRNAVKRLRVLKHPYLLKCLDAGEHSPLTHVRRPRISYTKRPRLTPVDPRLRDVPLPRTDLFS